MNTGHDGPVLATTTAVTTGNNTTSFLQESFVERQRLAITPEFDTENLASIASLAEGMGQLSIRAYGSNAPADVIMLDGTDPDPGRGIDMTMFDIDNNGNMDYKQDIRVHGRFLNYRITHDNTDNMAVAGMQFDIGKGGRR